LGEYGKYRKIMRKFYLYMRLYPFWVFVITITLWIGAWYTSGLPPVALILVAAGVIYFTKFAKEEMINSSKRFKITKFKSVSTILMILTAFSISGLVKIVISLSIWTFIWIFKGIKAADLIAKDNMVLSSYLDLFVCLPTFILFFVLYWKFKPQE